MFELSATYHVLLILFPISTFTVISFLFRFLFYSVGAAVRCRAQKNSFAQCCFRKKDERIATIVGHRRFIGTVMAIWSTFNNVADFAGRVNNVDGFISNV